MWQQQTSLYRINLVTNPVDCPKAEISSAFVTLKSKSILEILRHMIAVHGVSFGQVMKLMHGLRLNPPDADLHNIADDRMKTVIRNMLCFQPEQRYTMQAVCADIQAIRCELVLADTLCQQSLLIFR